VEQHTIASIFAEASMAATVLRVRSVEDSVAWYRDKLGLAPIHVGDDGPEHPIASFMIAGAVVALWQLAPGETIGADEDDIGTYVVAVMSDDLQPFRERLVQRGVNVGAISRSANNEYLWFYDPDGNRFELSRPRPAD
jgi:catechol 2,3-dioxygenase-like lactoylglutathione lyase family enzyme